MCLVKQELAKEGIIPCSSFFARGYDLHWRRLLLQEPKDMSRETPAAALFLHWCFSVLLILVTWFLTPSDAYSVLSSIYSYVFAAFFPAMIGLGMLWLRLRPRSTWSSKVHDPSFQPWLSFLSALFVVIAGLFIVVVEWIPPSGPLKNPAESVRWFVVPAVSCSVLGLGLLWWIGMFSILPCFYRDGMKPVVEKVAHLSKEDGYYVVDREEITRRRTPQ
jgi:hypothetical protein